MQSPSKVCPKCGTRYDAGAAFCQKDGAILHLSEEERDPRIGQTLLDQFRIEEKIGAGGMGSVYRARQTTVGRDVAIKILHPDLASNADAVRRFQREARISTALDHANVVRVFLFGQLPDGSLYLVMELLRGRPLADLLRVEPRMPITRALHILGQVCDGVGEAHEQGIVHRDVKPENVMLVTKGRDPDYVKVLDFGIARILRHDEQTMATQAGLVFGTARYISPEGAAGEQTDARSDVYSLGVLGYQLLCGETPFDASTPVTLLMKHIHEPPPHLKSRPGGAQVPDAIADVIMRALSKNPDGRYVDAHELAEVLRDAAARAGFPERRPGTGRFQTEGREASARQSLPAESYHSPSIQPQQPRVSAMPNGTEELSVAGLGRRKGDSGLSALTVAGAFVIGALAVIFGVIGVRMLLTPSESETRAAQLEAAETSLVAHRWVGDDGVIATTDAILASHPGDADALRIRHDAAELLVHEGDEQHAQGHDEQARNAYRTALTLDPSSEAQARLDALDHPVVHREEAIVVSPAPVEDQEVIVTATTSDAHTASAGDEPHFVLVQTHRHLSHTVPATPTGIEGTYSATYTFAQAGEYRVEFHAGSYTFSTTIEVARGAHPAGGGGFDPPVTTQGSLGPLPTVPIPSIVDAPIIHAVPTSLPAPFTTGSPTTTASAPTPPPIQPLSRPPTATSTGSSPPPPSSAPALPPAWTSTP
jgi:serine/threonine-protein kinase